MIGRVYLLHGEHVMVLARAAWTRGTPRNVLILRADGTETVSTLAPAASRSLAALRTASRTPGSIPAISVISSTTPKRSPDTPSSSPATSAGAGRAIDVESQGSWPAITSSNNAASSTVAVIGPIWSSDEANAMSP